MRKVNVGVIGCGNISAQYFRFLKQFEILNVTACADIDQSRARARAEEFGIPRALTVVELLQDPEIEIVVNLTIPAVHAEVSLKVLESGKHVYVEKPLAVEREDGRRVMDLAAAKGLLVGCAPDTVLGAGVQTCRKLIDEGAIGQPLSAVAFMMGGGHESWHPDPEFYYKRGGGPLFDMGPYYLSTLIQLLGPIQSVGGMAKISRAERIITSQPKAGTIIKVETPTHISGLLQFANGVIGTMIMSFDVPGGHHLPNIEVYGTEGSIRVPDPNTFKGEVQLRKKGEKEWLTIEHTHPYADMGRGLGVADLAYAIRNGRRPRAGGDIGFHVLDAMHGILEASDAGSQFRLQSTCERPEPMPVTGLTE
jgi:predicted dehydrogenase